MPRKPKRLQETASFARAISYRFLGFGQPMGIDKANCVLTEWQHTCFLFPLSITRREIEFCPIFAKEVKTFQKVIFYDIFRGINKKNASHGETHLSVSNPQDIVLQYLKLPTSSATICIDSITVAGRISRGLHMAEKQVKSKQRLTDQTEMMFEIAWRE